MNTLTSKLVQAACPVLLLLTAGLAFDLVRDMWTMPLWDRAAWSALAPQFGALVLFIAGIVAAEQAAARVPLQVPSRIRSRR